MSKINFVPEIFLESEELSKFQEFVFEEGFKKKILNETLQYGIVKNQTIDPNFENFKIIDGGLLNSRKTLEIGSGFIIAKDSENDVKFVRNRFFSKFFIPSDWNWYWIKVSPIQRSLETGVVSIDSQGNLIGNGTNFTKVLRGQPNFPARIRFYKIDDSDNLSFLRSTLNQSEYDVLEITGDENAILQGEFNNETELFFEVVGTFTPGYVVPEGDKGVFRYDDCLIEIVEENSVDGNPLKPSYEENEEFFIYRFRYDEVNGLDLQDFRYEIYKSKSDYNLERISDTPLPNVGVVQSRFDNENTTRTESLIEVEWGFFSESYIVDELSGKITLNQGSGGSYKTTNNFVTNDFNGWNLLVLGSNKNDFNNNFYSRIEKLFKIKNSIKNGTSIDLFIDQFSKIDFIPYEFSSTKLYTNNQRVSTESGSYILKTESSLGADLNTTDVYDPAVSYDSGIFLFYNGDLYVSLQGTNQNNTPPDSPEFWELVWEESKVQLVIVPDCEEIIFTLEVGEDVDGLENETLNRTFYFPTLLGRGTIRAVSINEVGSESQNDLIYNLKYQLKNNKVRNSIKVLPPNPTGYLTEVGDTLSYGTDGFVNKAFLRSIRSLDSYKDFKDRIDLGDLQGIDIITDLKIKSDGYVDKAIPIKVGVDKKIIRITGSSLFESDIKFKILDEGAKVGNKFQFIFEPIIENNFEFNVLFISESDSTLLTLNTSNLQNTNQIVWCERGTDYWYIYLEDNSFRGENHFEQNGFEILNVDDEGVIIDESGKKILVISGNNNKIQLLNESINPIVIDLVRAKNGRIPNELTFNGMVSGGVKWRYGATINQANDARLYDATGVGNNGGIELINFFGVKFVLYTSKSSDKSYVLDGSVFKNASSPTIGSFDVIDGQVSQPIETILNEFIPSQTIAGRRSYGIVHAKGTFTFTATSSSMAHEMRLLINNIVVDVSKIDIPLPHAAAGNKVATLHCHHTISKLNNSSLNIKIEFRGYETTFYENVKVDYLLTPAETAIIP